MHLALETLRTIDVSPHLATAMSNLAAALVTVGDYAPARELAQDALGMLPRYDNPQLWLFVRSNLAEAQLGTGDAAGALETVDAMLGDPSNPPRSAAQGHYLAVAAEVYAMHGRLADAERCGREAAMIQAPYPAGSNAVSNLMLSQYQYSVAQALGVSGATMVAAQSIGAAAGNMIAIHNVVAASATVGVMGREGQILRRTIIPTIYYVALAGILAMLSMHVLNLGDPLLGVKLP